MQYILNTTVCSYGGLSKYVPSLMICSRSPTLIAVIDKGPAKWIAPRSGSLRVSQRQFNRTRSLASNSCPLHPPPCTSSFPMREGHARKLNRTRASSIGYS